MRSQGSCGLPSADVFLDQLLELRRRFDVRVVAGSGDQLYGGIRNEGSCLLKSTRRTEVVAVAGEEENRAGERAQLLGCVLRLARPRHVLAKLARRVEGEEPLT